MMNNELKYITIDACKADQKKRERERKKRTLRWGIYKTVRPSVVPMTTTTTTTTLLNCRRRGEVFEVGSVS